MDEAVFDDWSSDYADMHRQSVGWAGDDLDFYAAYKVKDAAALSRHADLRVDTVLDFGCGIGNSLPHFLRAFPDAAIHGVDVSAQSLAIAERRCGGRAMLQTYDGKRLPYADGAFDLAFTACTFHHIPQEQHAGLLAEIRRIVRRGGLFVLFEHNPRNPLTRRAVRLCPFDADAVLIDANTMQSAIERAEFDRVLTAYRLFFAGPLAALRPIEPAFAALPIGAQYRVCGR